jgi:hypothetical protein
VPTLEEIVFQAGRDALSDQDGVVTGIRQRTGTLLAAHALVASFLGATTVKSKGLHGFSWAALVALLLGLIISAVLLSNWKLRFAVDAPDFYAELYDEAAAEAEADTLAAGLRRVRLPQPAARERESREDHEHPAHVLRRPDGPANPLLARGPAAESTPMAPRPVPPDEIKTPTINIGIQEGRGGSAPPAPRPAGQ